MTREEAIEYLQVKIHCADKGDEEAMREAMDIAIEILKQEPCEDCVSRKELLKYNTVCIDDDGINRFVVPTEVVRNLPPVQPIRPKGKWIKKPRTKQHVRQYTGIDVNDEEEHTIRVIEQYDGIDEYCSKCGMLVSDVSHNFCSNCGADMKKVEE